MRITDRYRSEHAVFMEQLGVIDALLRGGCSLDEAIAGITVLAAPLRRHAESEESALFPALDPDADAPIRVLTGEHSQIERWLEQLTTARLTRPDVIDIFGSLTALLRGHIVREDEILFPLAERALSASELAALDDLTEVPA